MPYGRQPSRRSIRSALRVRRARRRTGELLCLHTAMACLSVSVFVLWILSCCHCQQDAKGKKRERQAFYKSKSVRVLVWLRSIRLSFSPWSDSFPTVLWLLVCRNGVTSLSTSGIVLPEPAMGSSLISGEQHSNASNTTGCGQIANEEAVTTPRDLMIITCASAIASFLQSKESTVKGTLRGPR